MLLKSIFVDKGYIMCAIIGVDIKNPTEEDIEKVKKLFVESQIRGKHSTGIAFYNGDEIETFILRQPAEVFIKEFDFTKTISNNRMLFIGHCRYSTSDIHYPQPIVVKNVAIAHNGVVSQEPYEQWENLYGYKCVTKNDSELIIHHLLSSNEPLEQRFPYITYAYVLLREKQLEAKRNGFRPMWKYKDENKLIYASTQNILYRTFKNKNFIKIVAPEEFTFRTMRQPRRIDDYSKEKNNRN